MTPEESAEIAKHLLDTSTMTDADLRAVIRLAKSILLERQQKRASEKYLRKQGESK